MPDKSLIPWASCELLVAFKFAERGAAISIPLTPQPYDLVVDTGEQPPRLYRVQVKKSHYVPPRVRAKGRGDRECHRVLLIRRSSQTRQHRRLQAHEFDYLAVVCNPETIYIIPVATLQREAGDFLRHIEFKGEPENDRQDSARAASRWAQYLNNFALQAGST